MSVRLKIIDKGGFEYLTNKTNNECWWAVNVDGMNLLHIDESKQNYAICFQAVREKTKAFPYAKHKTDDIIKMALEKDGRMLKYVENKTKEFCEIAVAQDGMALKYVDECFQDEDLCLLALLDNFRSIQYVKNKTDKLVLSAIKQGVKQGFSALEYLGEISDELVDKILEAVNYNWSARFGDSWNLSYKISEYLVRRNGMNLKNIMTDSPVICRVAVGQNPMALEFCRHLGLKLEYGTYMSAISKNGNAFKVSPIQDYKLAIIAVKALNGDCSVLEGTRFSKKKVLKAIKKGNEHVANFWGKIIK